MGVPDHFSCSHPNSEQTYSDLLKWNGTTIPCPYSFPSSLPSHGILQHRLELTHALFCPNLNFIEPLCPVHGMASKLFFLFDAQTV